MASLVTDVLIANTDLLEKGDLGTRIGKLSANVDKIKGEIYHAVNNKYVIFKPTGDATQELHNRMQTLSGDMQKLSARIKGDISAQLSSSTSDLHDLTGQLDKTNAVIDVLQIVCKVDGLLNKFQSFIQNSEYLQAADVITELKSHLMALVEGGYCEVKIVKALRSELRVHQETLLHHLGQAWSAMVVWTLPHAGEPVSAATINQAHLKIMHSDNANVTATAMQQVGILKTKLGSFGKKLMETVLRPIVTFPSVTPVISVTKKSTTVGFKTATKTAPKSPDPASVYKNLMAVLKALTGPLLGLKTAGEDDLGNSTLMAMLGHIVWSDLSKCIINNCLVHSIPSNSAKLSEYEAVIKATEAFEASLHKEGFITESTSPLLTYARDVNVHFANKKCQELIVEARQLMKRELHNTKRVGCGKTTPTEEAKGQPDRTATDKNHVSEGIFALPVCEVSESVVHLVQLARQTLDEASGNSPQCAIQLFYTVRNMFEIFCDIVPTYHRVSLRDLPQASALHHNNCMYIGHHLMTLGHQYRQTLPPPLSAGAATFVDLIPVFRKLASECFLAQMRTQRNQLLESLSGAEGFDQVAADENFITSQKAIKQVLHQLGLLQRVWADVLPANIYTKAMSTLVNTALLHIVEKVTSLEDISADDAQQLHSLLSELQTRIPQLIKPKENGEEPVVVQSTVDQWTSFTELLFTLDASMQDIVDRWAEGKGPLAVVFSAAEVKSLIRAIFQNTDRRASALSKIR